MTIARVSASSAPQQKVDREGQEAPVPRHAKGQEGRKGRTSASSDTVGCSGRQCKGQSNCNGNRQTQRTHIGRELVGPWPPSIARSVGRNRETGYKIPFAVVPTTSLLTLVSLHDTSFSIPSIALPFLSFVHSTLWIVIVDTKTSLSCRLQLSSIHPVVRQLT